MISIRHANDRGHANHGWLDSHHTFSFASYYDPKEMGFSVLRVINEDRVAPGAGFDTHSHRDMEILSYVLEGELAHKDSMGSGSTIRPGDAQLMSAGRGVSHSEFNASQQSPVHFLQIWLLPRITGIQPNYQERFFDATEKRGRLRVIASPDGREGSLTIVQDAVIHAALLDGDEAVEYALPAGRRAYVHVARGSLSLNGQPLSAGDGAKIVDESTLRLDAGDQAEVLVFDLP